MLSSYSTGGTNPKSHYNCSVQLILNYLSIGLVFYAMHTQEYFTSTTAVVLVKVVSGGGWGCWKGVNAQGETHGHPHVAGRTRQLLDTTLVTSRTNGDM